MVLESRPQPARTRELDEFFDHQQASKAIADPPSTNL